METLQNPANTFSSPAHTEQLNQKSGLGRMPITRSWRNDLNLANTGMIFKDAFSLDLAIEHAYTQTHACIDVCTHEWTYACMHACMHACIELYIVCIYGNIHAYIFHTYLHFHRYIPTCMHACMHACRRTDMHTYSYDRITCSFRI